MGGCPSKQETRELNAALRPLYCASTCLSACCIWACANSAMSVGGAQPRTASGVALGVAGLLFAVAWVVKLVGDEHDIETRARACEARERTPPKQPTPPTSPKQPKQPKPPAQ
jgi:hypothetical protein